MMEILILRYRKWKSASDADGDVDGVSVCVSSDGRHLFSYLLFIMNLFIDFEDKQSGLSIK